LITALVTLDGAALLRGLDLQGHAGAGKRGEDVVCAAVSFLVRTAAAVLADKAYVTAQVVAPARGELHLSIECKREGEPYLRAIQDFLLTGLNSVAEEYPECLRVDVSRDLR
jgi:uncharacterized protein YsxB (DUF464 family)